MAGVFDSITVAQPTISAVPNQQQAVKVVQVASAPVEKKDEVVISSNQEKKSGGKITRGIAQIKKTFASISEHSKGFFNGLRKGLVSGSVVYTLGTIASKIRKDKTSKPLPSAALGIAVAVATLALNTWQGHLNANEKKSDIEHRWIGHQ